MEAKIIEILQASSPVSPKAPAAGHEWLAVGAGLLAVYVPTLHDLVTTVWGDEGHAHGPFILAAVLWLFWDKRQILSMPQKPTAPFSGFTFLLAGLLLYTVGRAYEVRSFEVASLVPVMAGILLAMRGWKAIRSCWFALFFCIFLIPLSPDFIDQFTLPLKQIVSTVVVNLLHAAGYPVAQNGVILSVGQYQLLVADACSGLHSMFSLSAVGLLYLYLKQHGSKLHNMVVVASLWPIAFWANIVRVTVLVLITYHYGDAAGQGFLHQASGLILFGSALLALVALDFVLARSLKLR